MHRFGFLPAAILAAGALAAGPAAAAAAEDDYRLSGPYTHDNLAIYLIHRRNGNDGPVPLTLGEAMERGAVRVIETGDVEELVVRNPGDREVFIQAGDIVKGGKQDRVLTVSMIVPPNSGDIAIGAFCVEHDRWEGRGMEKMREFSASTARLPSKAGRLALHRPVASGHECRDGPAPNGPGQADDCRQATTFRAGYGPRFAKRRQL